MTWSKSSPKLILNTPKLILNMAKSWPTPIVAIVHWSNPELVVCDTPEGVYEHHVLYQRICSLGVTSNYCTYHIHQLDVAHGGWLARDGVDYKSGQDASTWFFYCLWDGKHFEDTRHIFAH